MPYGFNLHIRKIVVNNQCVKGKYFLFQPLGILIALIFIAS